MHADFCGNLKRLKCDHKGVYADDCLVGVPQPQIPRSVQKHGSQDGTQDRTCLIDPFIIINDLYDYDLRYMLNKNQVDRVMKHKIYIVATNDRDLKRRIRKIPGVP